ncbi:proteasome protein [Prauserella marina]|uniref:Predicted ATP-dependent carboligase, ATP-grasp superfamily n=1 Tax=Prauserella marina TaxID=530584 RepID=A0A222VSZ8_9PSEU|nr:PAC2 family protein [Prauserella marina]ASR37065.1 proteasome protein [Prauserella marina]PWV79951.1 putative ATP-grasp superfamily ATP-dependent carboligase [Prauserella marina]SDD86357.1 Predicted ATP-dependent carboligase, ATP-grasp superfamily [Prauserella marina]
MVPDPEELYEVDSDVPVLDGAVLLYHLDGFIDAGSAGGAVAEHLVDQLRGEVVARFDVDRLIDYRSRRPPMSYAGDHWESYEAPELVVRLLHDHNATPFLLLTGPEPDREWERFTAAVRGLVERWQVRLSVNFHGIPMGVPHTRPLGVTAHGTRSELVSGYRPVFSQMQIPGSAASLLEWRLGQAGHDAVGFAAHVPHYLAQATYPAAGLALLDSIERATGLNLPGEQLRDAAARTDVEVDRQVRESEEVADVVRALERQYDTFTAASSEDNLLAGDAEMPTADELASQFERFLAEQRGRNDPNEP